MPLPPAPTKRAALLPPKPTTLRPASHKASRKSEAPQRTCTPPAAKPQVLDFEPRHRRRRRAPAKPHPRRFAGEQGRAPTASATSTAPPWRSRAPRPQKARHRPDQAVRAGHQRAAARPDEPVPLRRARHLPADDRAGRAGRPQEGHDRSRPQCPPDQPHAGRTGGAQGADIAAGLKLDTTGHREAAAACSSRPSRWTTACPPACPRARPTTRSWAW
jgi:PhoH-like ATPase